MNRVEPIPFSPGDDARLDAWLVAYFQRELPDPWPTFEPPQRARVLPFPRRQRPAATFRIGPRLALAAAAVLLFLGGWLLAGTFAVSPSAVLPEGGPPTAEKVRPDMPPAPDLP